MMVLEVLSTAETRAVLDGGEGGVVATIGVMVVMVIMMVVLDTVLILTLLPLQSLCSFSVMSMSVLLERDTTTRSPDIIRVPTE